MFGWFTCMQCEELAPVFLEYPDSCCCSYSCLENWRNRMILTGYALRPNFVINTTYRSVRYRQYCFKSGHRTIRSYALHRDRPIRVSSHCTLCGDSASGLFRCAGVVCSEKCATTMQEYAKADGYSVVQEWGLGQLLGVPVSIMTLKGLSLPRRVVTPRDLFYKVV